MRLLVTWIVVAIISVGSWLGAWGLAGTMETPIWTAWLFVAFFGAWGVLIAILRMAKDLTGFLMAQAVYGRRAKLLMAALGAVWLAFSVALIAIFILSLVLISVAP